MYQSFQNQGKEHELAFSKPGFCSSLNFLRTYFKLKGKIDNNTSIQHLPNPEISQNCSKRARKIMQHLLNKKSLLWALTRQFMWEIFVSSFLVLLDFIIKILNSILMGTIIRYLTSDKEQLKADFSHQVVFGSFFILLFIGIYPRLWAFQWCNSFGAKLRFTMTHLVYFKVGMVSSYQLQQYGLGKLMNLVSNDLNDLENGVIWIFQLFLLPVTLSIGTYALWRAFGWYSIGGIIVLVISLKIQDTISKSVKAPLQQKNKIADKRIYYCKQLIKNIKTIKMYVLQKKLIDIINDFREKEIGFNFNVMLNQGISKLLSYFSVMFTILAMVVSRLMLEEQSLNKELIYAAIGILGVIRNTNFNGGLNYLTTIKIIMDRADTFLNLKILPERKITPIQYVSHVSSEVQIQRIRMNARLKLPELRTQKSSQDIFLFKKIDKRLVGTINLKTHNRVFIVGESGSGKTAIIESFLNQSQFYSVENMKGKIAYVPQQPILFNSTVRENITFGKTYIQQKFNQVLQMCCLTKDIHIFPEGAETKVRMQGSSFSGGQRARIGLARALYSDAPIFLMDNCLSALDPQVRKQVHKNIFGQKYKNKIIIFSTSNNDELIDDCFLIRTQNKEIDWFDICTAQILKKSNSMIELAQQKPVSTQIIPPPPSAVQEMLQESDKGNISRQTYMYYLKHLGTDYKGVIKVAAILALFIICQLSALRFYKNLPQVGTDTWVTIKLLGNYLTMYVCLDYLRSYVMVMLASTNSVECHKELVKNIGYAKYSWYSKRQSQLTNVFANHVGITDRPLPNILYDVVKGLLSNFIYILNLCIVTPAFIPIAIILTIGLWLVKRFLQKYIRKCKMLQLKYRSPVYNKLAQYFTGAILVRNYNVQKEFQQEFATTAYQSQKSYFAFIQINRFLDLVLEIILFLMIVLGVTLTLIFSANSSDSNLALSMFTLINMTSELSYIIRQTITVELNLISLQKILSYRDVPKQIINESLQNDTFIPIPKGEIVFQNVRMKYPGSSNYCLNNINLTISPGQKIAIMGRTGAGKSSIFLALYRLFELQPGSTIKVGGMDIETIDLYTLRKYWLSCSAQDALRLPPLTSSASPSQLKFQSIVNQNRTPIKLLDEPFANIDQNLQLKLWEHIYSLSTVLSVVHSGDLSKWTRIITLENGQIRHDTGPSPRKAPTIQKPGAIQNQFSKGSNTKPKNKVFAHISSEGQSSFQRNCESQEDTGERQSSFKPVTSLSHLNQQRF